MLGGSQEVSSIDISSQIHSVGDAVELLKQVAAQHSEKPIIVLDEFDTIKDLEERNKFASLLKQLGDQSVNLKFIFTGIAKSLDELLGAHQSAYRQLETVQLMRLCWEGRRKIVVNAASAFGLSVNDNLNWRIAMVSDGFPYYVHLIAEKMLWAAFDAEDEVSELSWDHYHDGLSHAIQSINAELRKPYEHAVIQRDPQYEWIVWATADGEDLFRSLKDMFAAYKRIMEKSGHADAMLEPQKFNEHIRKLKTKSFGEILEQVTNRNGWYMYKEKMLRGYVRMQAEANGVELTGEKAAPKQSMHIRVNVKTGTYGPSIPSNVRLKNEHKSSDDSK